MANTNVIKITFTMIVYLHETFHLANDCGVIHGASESMIEKPKDWIIGLISWNFQYYIKTMLYVIHYLFLSYWSKFRKNMTAFGGVMAKKPPKSSLKSNLLLLSKYLKVYNLVTTNDILMKLNMIVYLHDTFYFWPKIVA